MQFDLLQRVGLALINCDLANPDQVTIGLVVCGDPQYKTGGSILVANERDPSQRFRLKLPELKLGLNPNVKASL